MQNRILIVIEDGTFKGASITTETGAPTPLDQSSLAAVLPDLNAAAFAEIEHLKTAHAEALEILRGQHAAEIAALQSAFAPKPLPSILTTLGSTYESLPTDVQIGFAPAFAIVRVLVETGRNDLAAAHVAGLAVPDHLIATRDQIVALLS